MCQRIHSTDHNSILNDKTHRKEIVEHRKEHEGKVVEEPKRTDPAFRALVEENVKAGVERVAHSPVIQQVCLYTFGKSVSN
jgi:carbonic anhydrase